MKSTIRCPSLAKYNKRTCTVAQLTKRRAFAIIIIITKSHSPVYRIRPSAIISPCSLQRAVSPFRPLFSLQFYDGLPSDAWQIIVPDFSVELVTPSSPAGIHWLSQGPVGATVDAWLPLPVSLLSLSRERESGDATLSMAIYARWLVKDDRSNKLSEKSRILVRESLLMEEKRRENSMA